MRLVHVTLTQKGRESEPRGGRLRQFQVLMDSSLLIACVACLLNLDKASTGPKEDPGGSHKND